MRPVLVLLAVCAPLLFSPPAAAVDMTLADRLDASLGQYFRPDAPGAVVLVQREGKTILRKAYGLADLTTRQPLTPETPMRLGSLTKQFTAVAVLLLADEGKLALTDDITRFLPDYPTQGRKITVEHLLTHTSGIPNFTARPDYLPRQAQDATVDGMIARFRDDPLQFDPGTRFSYSNSGYFLLGAIIEKASGQPYAQFLAQRIFIPLGMRDTAYEGHERSAARRAVGYTGTGGRFVPTDALSMTQPYAAGALVSTVDDLARWNAAIGAGKLLKEATWRKAFTPYTLADGTSTRYGYGWGIGDWQGAPFVSHGGGINGFATYAARLPRQDVFVAVLENADMDRMAPEALARKAAAIAIGKPLPEYRTIALDAAALQPFTGQYDRHGKDSHKVLMRGNELLLQRQNGTPRRLLPWSSTAFVVENTLVTVQFTRGPDGRVTGATVDDGNAKMDFSRSGDVPAQGQP